MALVKRSWEETLVIGHRGAASEAPENTLAAFEAGIASGAVGVECDVHFSADRQMAVIHDDTLDRTTNLTGAVRDTPMDVMRPAGVPTLPELTDVTRDRAVLVVELKDGEGIELAVVDHLREAGLVDQSICFDFDAERIARAKARNPDQYCVWLVPAPAAPAAVFERLKATGADGLGVYYEYLTEEVAQLGADAGVPLFVWTVPPGPEIDRLVALGANFIITDSPSEVVRQIRGKRV